MILRAGSCLLALAFHAAVPASAETIVWFCDANSPNRDSAGVAMDSGFQFELGVFAAPFVPTAANAALWSAHWTAADAVSYDASTQRFTGQFPVMGNPAPFLVGAKAWIFGHRVTPTGTEGILFRASDWLWPAPNPMNPFTLDWNAKDADEVVLGSINPDASPFLMQSVLVKTYAQWRTTELAGEAFDGPNDDPDQDGTSNLLEFVFGTPPGQASPPVATPLALVETNGQRFVQTTIPRRLDHLATLTVEVSGDLLTWNSGAPHTTVISDTQASLVVRDTTPLAPPVAKRFLRLRAVLP